MKIEDIFFAMESFNSRTGAMPSCICLTPEIETTIRLELLANPEMLGDGNVKRLQDDPVYLRKFFNTMGGIPVHWDAPEFELK